MAERALTEEAMLAGLHDIRLPADAPGGLAAELFAAVGTGILLAAAVAALLRLFMRVRSRLNPEVSATQAGSEDAAARRRALLLALKRERPERFAEIADGLYRPGGLPDIESLRALAERP